MADQTITTPYYSDYLQLDRILDAQDLKSVAVGRPADDEMLFIIVHQVYDLWFKQILFELDLVLKIFSVQVNDNSPDMSNAVHRLKRINHIFVLVNQQFDVLESMTSLDFLDFRDLLVPASGFQSKQFRMIEARLGLKSDQRYMANYYRHSGPGGFSAPDIQDIVTVEGVVTLKNEIIGWLERTPFLDAKYWVGYTTSNSELTGVEGFWSNYGTIYVDGLSQKETENARAFDVAFQKIGTRDFSPKAMRAVLFNLLYRDYPLLHLPFHLLNTLTELDELLSTWRHRHAVMVNRLIGSRVGYGRHQRSGFSTRNALAAKQHFPGNYFGVYFSDSKSAGPSSTSRTGGKTTVRCLTQETNSLKQGTHSLPRTIERTNLLDS